MRGEARNLLTPAVEELKGTILNAEYAGWWRRAIASLIDDCILATTITVAANFLLVAAVCLWHFIFREPRPFIGHLAVIVLYLGGPVIWWLYVTGFESSLSQATPGKRLLGLYVLRTNGMPFTFWLVTKKMIFYPMLSIIGFSFLVIVGQSAPYKWRWLFGLIFLAILLVYVIGSLCFFNKRRQTLIDLLNKRVVWYQKPQSVSTEPHCLSLHEHEKKLLACFGCMILLTWAGRQVQEHFNIDEDYEAMVNPPHASVNNSGAVLLAVHDLKRGDLLKKSDFKKSKLAVVSTPLFALNPGDPFDDHTLIMSDIPAGCPLTYQNLLPQSVGISKIISIEPLPNSPAPAAQEATTDWHYTPEAEAEHDEVIDRNLLAAIADNKNQKYSQALDHCEKVIRQVNSVESEAHGLKSIPNDPHLLSKFDFSSTTMGWKNITLNTLHERILANKGLGNKELARTDCATALKLVRALHENWLDEVRHIYFWKSNDTSADHYLQMAANADEKSLRQTFNQLLKGLN